MAKRGSERANALWGKGGRGSKLAALLAVAVLGLVVLGSADVQRVGAVSTQKSTAFVSTSLMNQASANPKSLFNVIVTGNRDANLNDVGNAVRGSQDSGDATAPSLKKKFAIVDGGSATLTGRQILKLAKDPRVQAITLDYRVARSTYSNSQIWPDAAQVSSFWPLTAGGVQAPTIAVVDTGVDAAHPDLAGHVLAQFNFVSTGAVNSPGDGNGHGTFVAGIAAGTAANHAGAAPGANIVSLDVLADNGSGTLGDVLSACQWIADNKNQYGIRIANFSLNAGGGSSFMFDPLDKCVENLWFSGVTVVVAAGNYGISSLTPSRVLYSPANDPFVVTVGASDTNGTVTPFDDFAAPWSAWGRTLDGFAKPDLAAPGRVMTGPVPDGSYLITLHPERAMDPGYMWLSGTSMATPVVSGAAAYILTQHPNWTPDQVKGALMSTAALPLGLLVHGPLGAGVVQAQAAANANGVANPNAGLDQFVTAVPTTGRLAFDAASWQSAASTNASWDSASWDSASWDSASWDSASWSSASWDSASWDSASWDSATWLQ
ncbi:MAG: S8 family peptidase [Gaiellaceae bacterium]